MPNKAKSKAPTLETSQNHLDFVDAPDIDFQPPFEEPPVRKYSQYAIKFVAIYVAVTFVLALLLSNTVLSWMGLSNASLAWLHTIKFGVFILGTGAMIYYLILKRTNLLLAQKQELEEVLIKAQRLNQISQLISDTNRAILRIRDKEQLLKDICHILKEVGQYTYVWIGISESVDSHPNMIVTSGKSDEYIRLLFDGLQSASATERGEPALSALRKKYSVVINDVAGFSKNTFAWQSRALKFNFNSIAAFPFKTAAGLNGVVALYAKELNYFSEAETALLRSLSADVSFGLSDIEHKTQLYYAANYDVVTHLPNRQLYEDRLMQATSRALHDKRFVGVVIVEIDNLKKTVETLGQAVGDKLLQETGNHLMRLVRDGDTVARIAHNQIGIMLADVAEALDVALVSQKLMKSFGVHLTKQDEVKIYLRAGVAIYPQDGETASVLIQNAVAALSEMSKDVTSECAFYSKQLSSGLKYSQQIKQALSSALERNEFSLYYQPIVDISTRKLIGVEALARWRHASLGDVSPVQFIAEAEATGLIIPLGEWVIKTACQQLMQWHQRGQDNLMMTVNISTKQLIHPQFIESVKTIFKQLSFDSHAYQLAFEIPENALIEELKYTLEVLLALHELGLKVIVDDFGTGYSSLSYLHQLPVDILKIDPMFVRNLGKDHNTQALIRGIQAFADGLNIKTIAEGVETEQQEQMLLALGCQYQQGYLYSAPVAAKNLESFFGKTL